MCIMCVEIMRERITIQDGLKNMREAIFGDSTTSPAVAHVMEIVKADRDGDVNKVKELVKAGYKKERWI